MSDLMDLNLDDVQDPTIVDDGTYQAVVSYASVRYGKDSGRPFVTMLFSIEDNEDAKGINDNLMYPVGDDKDSTKKMFLRNMKAFCVSASIDFSEFESSCREAFAELDEGVDKPRIALLEGQQVTIKVKTEKNEVLGEEQNIVDRYLA